MVSRHATAQAHLPWPPCTDPCTHETNGEWRAAAFAALQIFPPGEWARTAEHMPSSPYHLIGKAQDITLSRWKHEFESR